MTLLAPSPDEFFAPLIWIDGRPLLETIEPYRLSLFRRALYSFEPSGRPEFNLVLTGRAKKNFKTTDLVLAALYRFLCWTSPHGNDCFIVANDEDQAGDDLALAKKLLQVNAAELGGEVEVYTKEIRRRDGQGSLAILPARDAIGAHGKTALFLGFDEIHGFRNWDLFEALAPDPTRPDALTWIASYDTIFNSPGVPLYDLKARGVAGDDPRMLFSWYSGQLCTDPSLVDLPPEVRANPSMGSWPEGAEYIEQQRRRLPAHKFRRLHLNLPGAPSGAFLDPDSVLTSIVAGRRSLRPQAGRRYRGFVDMSGGSSDDACLSIAHADGPKVVVDLVEKQAGEPPFNPRHAVARFAATLREYGLSSVVGDDYAGETFKQDFAALGITYRSAGVSKTVLYEELEPKLNAGEVELPDVPKLQEQLLTLVWRGHRIDHIAGEHDDFANAAAGSVWLAAERRSAPVAQSGTFRRAA